MPKKQTNKNVNKKSPHPITKPQTEKNNQGKPKKAPNWHDTYFCMRSWRERPAGDDFLEEIGKEFYDWCYNLAFVEKDLKPYSFTRWRLMKGFPEGTFDSWRARNKVLDNYIKEGIMLLGLIREQGLMNKQLSERAVMYTMPVYSKEWRDVDKYHDDRKQKSIDKLSSLIGAVIEEVDLDDKNREVE